MNCIFLRRGYGEGNGFPPKGKALNDYTWEEISLISTGGKAAEYFSVGDRKQIVLNGTVGNLTLSNFTTYAFIIGIYHNPSIEGENLIHFQLGKTALTDGIDIAFIDSKRGSSVSTTGYFSMKNVSNNTGGWKSSQMRTNICGTSLTSYSGTIVGVIPEELRTVIKPVTKYTNNTGGSTGESLVTATTDYFFLLSEYEVFGSIQYSDTYEPNKQAQYAYYSEGNSKIKYRHNATSSTAPWWLRSPNAGSNNFTAVNGAGAIGVVGATISYGFAPAFCV